MRTPAIALSTALAAGLLLGPADFLCQLNFPYPFANLANSSAIWAIAAFALGRWLKSGLVWTAVSGALMLLTAVESYYAAASLIQGDDLSSLWATPTLLWLTFGAIAGPIFASAGTLSRDPETAAVAGSVREGRLRMICRALPSAILFAEAAVMLTRGGGRNAALQPENVQTALLETLIALGLLFAVSRTTPDRLRTLAMAAPLALLGFAGLILAGFGG